MMRSVFVTVALCFPVLLLLAVLGMEQVERRVGAAAATPATEPGEQP